jgi:hypothetical protein
MQDKRIVKNIVRLWNPGFNIVQLLKSLAFLTMNLVREFDGEIKN